MGEILRYKKAAADWIEALPMGNGRIGAMVYGRPQDEIISLNEDTLWAGEYKDRRNYACKENLEDIRKKIFSEDYAGANRSIIDNVLGGDSFPYLPLGDLLIHMDSAEVYEYSRTLNLQDAISTVEFKSEGAHYKREVLVSEPDQVMAVHQTCDRQNSINMHVRLTSPLHNQLKQSENELIMKGLCPSHMVCEADPSPNRFLYTDRGVHFEARVRVILNGGCYRVLSDALEITGADEVLLLFGVRTSFQRYNLPQATEYSCKVDLDKAAAKGFDKIKKDHIADVRTLYDRVKLEFSTEESELTTDRIIREFTRSGAHAAELTRLKFHFGRYILIACSRPGTQPANLQGIWNRKLRAKWSSNYTININTQMNYMLAPMLGLAECQEPLDRMLEELAEDGAITAREMYGLNGWVAHHNSDLWRLTSPIGHNGEAYEEAAAVHGTVGHGPVRYGMWTMGGAWLCRHIWDKYLYTLDEEYLKKMYPLVKGAAQFMLGFLVEHEGKLVTCPSTSPENEFVAHGGVYAVTYGSTMDIAIVKDLFSICLAAQDVLGKDETYNQLMDSIERLPKFKVGKHGQIMEWQEEFEETEVAHRHVSHLYAVYPANNLPENLYDSLKITLERRTDKASAWESSWRAAIWARLRDGERAFKLLRQQMTEGDRVDEVEGRGGIYCNLLDCYPPFQIDGTLGYSAALAEMLIQSHRDEIELLPAIPTVLNSGKLSGFLARGGVEVSMEWLEGRVIAVSLRCEENRMITLRANGEALAVCLSAGEPVNLCFA